MIPIKRLENAKTSFAGILTSVERKEMVLAMLEDMVEAIRRSEIAYPVLLSPDPEVHGWCKVRGIQCLHEPGLLLNEALKWGMRELGKDQVLIMPGDLPLLRPDDIIRICSLAKKAPMVISPSRSNGTNALFLKPPYLIPLQFGGESFPAHLREAEKKGVVSLVYRSPRLELDIDDASDIPVFMTRGLGTRTYQFFMSLVEGGNT